MTAYSQALYYETDVLSWKTSYPICYIKDVPEPPIQKYSYISRFFPTDKILKKFIENKSNKYAWQMSFSPDGLFVVILKNNNLELRSSKFDFKQIHFQCQIYKDLYPQWRTIFWSNCSNYFGISFSNGMCNVWDVHEKKLSINTNCAKSNEFDIIIKVLVFSVSKSKIKVFVFTLNGKLFLYNINDFKIAHSFPLNISFLNSPILCCESPSNVNMMVFGTYNQMNNSYVSDAFKSGIVLCRFIDENPFVIPNVNNERSVAISHSWFSFFSNKKYSDAAIMIRISKDDSKLAALHFSGKLSVWNFPSLSLCFTWNSSSTLSNNSLSSDSIKQNVFPNHFTDSSIEHICWWNSEYVTVALRNGRILILDSEKSEQSQNECIMLHPVPQVEESIEKMFFVLNCLSKSTKISRHDRKSVQIAESPSSWNFIGSLMNYFLADNQSLTMSGKLDYCSQSYTMSGFKLTTPEELFDIKINKKQYSEALILATQYDLDSDLVFKKQWRDSIKSIDDIKHILIKIKKRNWILNECLEQIPNDINSMKFLLKLGLYLTDIEQWENEDNLEEDTIETIGSDFRNSSVDDDVKEKLQVEELSLVQVELIRIRMKLLNYYDKLVVYERIFNASKDVFKVELFEELKNLSSFEIAIKFARANDIVGLRVLLEFYNSILFNHILTILSNIPECIKPMTYRDLIIDNLSKLYNKNGSLLTKELDWCESDKFTQIYNTESTLHEAENTYYQSNQVHTPFILRGISDFEHIVRDWCHLRIRKIEFETLNASNALEILQIFKELELEIDNNLEFNLRYLYEGIYNCQVSNMFISLTEFEELPDIDKANMLMSKTNSDRFLVNFNRWIMPMLVEANILSSERPLHFFQNYIVNLGKNSLVCVRKLLEDSETMAKLNDIIGFRNIVNSYLTILSNDNEVSNINDCSYISRLLSSLVPAEFICEIKQIELIDNCIKVLRILEKYESKKTIKFVFDNKMNGELVENLITNMIYHYLKSVKDVNKVILKSVFNEIQIALSLVFKSVHPTLIYKNLLKSMLESGDMKKINLACDFMVLTTNLTTIDDSKNAEKLIDFEEAVQCILVAVRNYIDMSPSSKDKNILLAKYCLNLVKTPTDEIIAENEIIRCSEFLDKWHCSLVPIEFRSIKSRFELLKNCLDKNDSLYRDMKEVVEAGTYLYDDKKSDQKFREGEALRLVAQKAYFNKDIENLEIAMNSLVHRNHKPCWQECIMTLKMIDYPAAKKSELGRYAVTYCPDRQLTETIRFVNDVEVAALTLPETTSADIDPPRTNTNSNSNLLTQHMKFLSYGLTDLSSKINLKSLIDRSSDTLSKLTSQVTYIDFRGSQESFYKNPDNKLLKEMRLHLIYNNKCRPFEQINIDNGGEDIVKMLTLSSIINEEKRDNDNDKMYLKMVQFNVNRDTFLAIVHSMFIKDVSLIYNLRNEYTANTYSRVLIYCMVALNLILKYSEQFPNLNEVNMDTITELIGPLQNQMRDSDLSIFDAAYQELKDYLLLDRVIVELPSVCVLKFFSSVDYRRTTIFKLSEFCDNVKLLPYALLLADRYNVDRYEVLWNYFVTFVTSALESVNQFEENCRFFNKVFNVERVFKEFGKLFSMDIEKLLSTDSGDEIAKLKVILQLIPEQCTDICLFNKTVDTHKRWIEEFDLIFHGSDKCDYLDLCKGNKVAIVNCLKQVVNADNVDLCAQILTEFDLSEIFTKIKNDFSFVLANQMLWSNKNGDFLQRFNNSLKNFSVNDADNCKDFIFNALFEKSETYVAIELKVGALKIASKYVDDIVNSVDESMIGKWSGVSLEVTIWLDHLENTVVKVIEKLRHLSSVTGKIVVSAEYLSPDNYWQCLLIEMLLEGVSYQDLFTLTWDLTIDSMIINDSICLQLSHLCSSKFLPIDAIVEKLSQILDELDDYMDSDNVQMILEQVLEKMKDSSEQVHRMLLDEYVFRVRQNKSVTNLPIHEHVLTILKGWGLPVNEHISFKKNNLHLIDAFMQDCDTVEKMTLIPKVIELIELIEEDNNLWQCWIKFCVIRGPNYCSFVYEQIENLKKNKLYCQRIERIAKDTIHSLSAFNSADAISILILMDPITAVDKVNAILVSLKSDPTEFTNTMKNINVKALQIIVDRKLIPIYAKTVLFQRLVNYITREINDPTLVQKVLEQLKDNGLTDEATWLTSSSSHINPAMKTIEMVSGFWKRFSNN